MCQSNIFCCHSELLTLHEEDFSELTTRKSPWENNLIASGEIYPPDICLTAFLLTISLAYNLSKAK